MAPRPYHRIDARTAAEHLAHGPRYSSSVEMWIGPSFEVPILLSVAEFQPPGGVLNLLQDIRATRLQQEHVHGRVFGETSGDNRTGRA